MVNLVLVFAGGGTGAVCRYLGGMGWLRAFGPNQAFLATLCINVVGGLLMGGLIGGLALRGGGSQERWRLLLGVGVVGGFTTFSSFSLETVMMLQRKAYALAGSYVMGSVVLSAAGVVLGLIAARKLLA